MREKVPVISTDVGGIKDVLGDGEAGIIVKPCDTNCLKQAMCRLIYDRALAEVLTERAEGLLYQNYTSTVMVKKYMHLYEDIIESSEGNHSL